MATRKMASRAKKRIGVDDDGGDAGLEVAQGDEARLGGHLEDQPRREQDEEH